MQSYRWRKKNNSPDGIIVPSPFGTIEDVILALALNFRLLELAPEKLASSWRGRIIRDGVVQDGADFIGVFLTRRFAQALQGLCELLGINRLAFGHE